MPIRPSVVDNYVPGLPQSAALTFSATLLIGVGLTALIIGLPLFIASETGTWADTWTFYVSVARQLPVPAFALLAMITTLFVAWHIERGVRGGQIVGTPSARSAQAQIALVAGVVVGPIWIVMTVWIQLAAWGGSVDEPASRGEGIVSVLALGLLLYLSTSVACALPPGAEEQLAFVESVLERDEKELAALMKLELPDERRSWRTFMTRMVLLLVGPPTALAVLVQFNLAESEEVAMFIAIVALVSVAGVCGVLVALFGRLSVTRLGRTAAWFGWTQAVVSWFALAAAEAWWAWVAGRSPAFVVASAFALLGILCAATAWPRRKPSDGGGLSRAVASIYLAQLTRGIERRRKLAATLRTALNAHRPRWRRFLPRLNWRA
ncbi:hypothetical protein ACFXP7_13880 [Microbacterium sp. P06]|uniref:hypothetical protein n=1 Tax=Microbacterium sp. P06 TaxID=3366949 RepID=UPI0037463C05